LSGLPTCRQEAGIFVDGAARAAGVKIIALERAGYGASDEKPGQRIVDYPDDVAAALDFFGVARCAVMGVSGGGPFALACGARIPERVSQVLLVSGLGPFDVARGHGGHVFRLLATMASRPRLCRFVYGVMRAMGRIAPGLGLAMLTLQMPPLDRVVLRRRFVWNAMRDFMMTEPLKNGVARAVWETHLYAHDWGFALDDVKVPVRLWHGEADLHVPVQMGRELAARLPSCTSTFVKDGGHLCVVDVAPTIFAELAA
jgi:pimeloyl-ACP methyl ester carboxylesterase